MGNSVVESRQAAVQRIAKALKENGVADNIIATTTGIPEEQIATLE